MPTELLSRLVPMRILQRDTGGDETCIGLSRAGMPVVVRLGECTVYAVRTGAGLAVVSCLTPEAAEAFVDEFPEAADTLQVDNSDGVQFFFYGPPGVYFRTERDVFGPDIDVIGTDDFIVPGPGSACPRGGPPYTIGHAAPIATASPALLSSLKEVTP